VRQNGRSADSDDGPDGAQHACLPAVFLTTWRTGFDRSILAAGFFLLLALAIVAARAEETDSGDDAGFGTLPDAPHYTVQFEGINTEKGLGKLLVEISNLVQLRKTPPASLAGLDRRAADDLESFATALRSEGYYGYILSYDIDDEQEPVAVTVKVDTGPIYKLESYDVVYTGFYPAPSSSVADLSGLGLKIGMNARAPFITGARAKLMDRLAENARPLANVEDEKIIVDHATQAMRVTMTIDPGPAVTFGRISFEGLADVDAGYLERLVPWKAGDPYDKRLVDEYRHSVAQADLFESISIVNAASANPDGSLPMTVSLIEGKHRTIGGSLSYSTDIGPGVAIFWEHRNAFGEGERARLQLDVSPVLQEFSAVLRKPAFHRIDQALLLQATARRENDDAYDEQSVSFYGGIERQYNDHWTFNVGGDVEFSDITDSTGSNSYLVFGIPLGAYYDGTDDLLNPSEGFRLSTVVEPTLITYPDTKPFLSTDVSGSTYYSPFENDRVIFAMRGRIGSIVGAGPNEIPANRRFYAGGGGSVRGYKFQSIGPLAANNDPLGGTSVWEASLEMRIRVTDTIGVVPFVDAGQVGRDPWPDFDVTPQVAAGLGFRYYTDFGPLRFDVAFPLNPRPSDKSFQFYFSIGQAF